MRSQEGQRRTPEIIYWRETRRKRVIHARKLMHFYTVYTHKNLPPCMMDLKRKSHAGPMPWTIKTRWSTFSGSPGNRQTNEPQANIMMGAYSPVFLTGTPTYVPSGISTEMLSTPLLTVRGLVCSEGEDAHSSCNPIRLYCIITWERRKQTEEKMLSRCTAWFCCVFDYNVQIDALTASFTLGLWKITVSPVGNSSFLFHSSKVTAII